MGSGIDLGGTYGAGDIVISESNINTLYIAAYNKFVILNIADQNSLQIIKSITIGCMRLAINSDESRAYCHDYGGKKLHTIDITNQ